MKIRILTHLSNLRFGKEQNNTTHERYVHLKFISAVYTVNSVSYVPRLIVNIIIKYYAMFAIILAAILF